MVDPLATLRWQRISATYPSTKNDEKTMAFLSPNYLEVTQSKPLERSSKLLETSSHVIPKRSPAKIAGKSY